MINTFISILKIFLSYSLGCMKILLSLLYKIYQTPTSVFGIVAFLSERNIVLFGNAKVTEIVLSILTLVISHLIHFLPFKFRKRNYIKKELIGIGIYFLIIFFINKAWPFFFVILPIIIILVLKRNNKKNILGNSI